MFIRKTNVQLFDENLCDNQRKIKTKSQIADIRRSRIFAESATFLVIFRIKLIAASENSVKIAKFAREDRQFWV